MCNCDSVWAPSTQDQWPVTTPGPHGGSGISRCLLWRCSSWTTQQPLTPAVLLVTQSEKWNCWLFTIISNFGWVFPAKYVLDFYTVGVLELAFWKWNMMQTLHYWLHTFSQIAQPFARQQLKHSRVLCCCSYVYNTFSLRQAFRPFLFWLNQSPPQLHIPAKGMHSMQGFLIQISRGLFWLWGGETRVHKAPWLARI